MPPSTSDGPLNTLEQIRDLLQQMLSHQVDASTQSDQQDTEEKQQEQSSEAESVSPPGSSGEGKTDGDGDGKKKRKGREADLFDHSVGLLGSIGGAPGQIGALLGQLSNIADQSQKVFADVSKYMPDVPQVDDLRPLYPDRVQPPPLPDMTGPVQPPPLPGVQSSTPTVLAPGETSAVPPPLPGSSAISALVDPAPMPVPQPNTPAAPTLDASATAFRVEPPDLPSLVGATLPAPATPVPLAGQETDVDTRLPPREEGMNDALSQTAPVLIPGAPGGTSGSASPQDSARLAAAIERLIALLDKKGSNESGGEKGDGDETEQGENWQQKNIWTPASEASPADRESLPVPPAGKPEGGSKDDPLEPGKGVVGSLLNMAMMRVLGT